MAQTQTRSTSRNGRRTTKTQRRRSEPSPSEYAKEALAEWGKAVRHGAAAVAPESGAGAGRRAKKRAREEQPSEYAKEAVSEWGKAVRYGAAALAPIAERTRERVKGAVARKAAGPDKPSLRDRLNPAKTDKGGRIGDAADALLAKMGTPGKLASKASLGSRLVDRVLPTDHDEEEPAEAEPPEEVPEAEAETEEPESEEPESKESGGDREEQRPEPAAGQDGGGPEAQSADDREIEFEYERAYEARHNRPPPNAYPSITE